MDDVRPSDFAELRAEIAKHCKLARLGNEISRVMSVFKFGMEEDLADARGQGEAVLLDGKPMVVPQQDLDRLAAAVRRERRMQLPQRAIHKCDPPDGCRTRKKWVRLFIGRASNR